MIKAIYKRGIIFPVDPVPANWTDGQELTVDSTEAGSIDSPAVIDQWYQDVEAAVALLNDPEEHKRIREALAEADERAKEFVRKEMGLP